MRPLSIPQFKALCYADIFDYPLKKEEIDVYQIGVVNNLQNRHISFSNVYEKDGYYYLKGKSHSIAQRKKRARYSRSKEALVYKYRTLFSLIPTLQLMALTGTVAAGNAKKDDDIDILIISKTGWLWTTRFLLVILTELLGIRRRPDSTRANNKFCFNMFMDDTHLRIPKSEQDIFSANELARIKIIFNKNDTLTRLWKSNTWVFHILPCIKKPHMGKIAPRIKKTPFSILETISRTIQVTYMRNRRTTEVIKPGYIRFHPYDARHLIMQKYQKRLERFGLE